MNGLAIAYGLARLGIHSTLFDENPFGDNFKSDIRTSFISHKTMSFLMELADDISSRSGIIEHIYSFKNSCKPVIELTGDNMGYVADNSTLKNAMARYIRQSNFVTIVDNHKIQSITSSPEQVMIDSQKFTLAICAMGARSSIHKTLNIKQSIYNYNQTAFVFDIDHTIPHKNIAVEIFGSNYILAVLPKHDPCKSSIILNMDSNSADMKETEVLNFMQSQERLRHIGEIQGFATPVIKYPLSTRYCNTQYKDSIFLIGDAFHAIHPVLGQGFNMSVKDIVKLCNHIDFANKTGISPAIGLDTLSRKNITNHLKIGLATHFFAKAFITQNKYASYATNALIKIGSIIPSKITSSILQKVL